MAEKKFYVSMFCGKCGVVYEGPREEAPNNGYECPKCGNLHIARLEGVVCHCGCIVWLGGFTEECDNCGQLYNGFGQELASPNQWDEEDRYGTFGPQNYEEDY